MIADRFGSSSTISTRFFIGVTAGHYT
jgi:hypothetical protein